MRKFVFTTSEVDWKTDEKTVDIICFEWNCYANSKFNKNK
jgi:hypothetical protein